MAAPRKYPEELRERATRLALEARKDPAGRVGAIKRVADQLDIHLEALRGWVRQAENARERSGRAQERCPAVAAAAAVGQPRRHRIAINGQVVVGREVAEQPGDAGESALDGPSRESCFTVFESDDLRSPPRLLLRRDERENVRGDDVGRLLGHDREEDLQVVGRGQQR